MITTIQKYLVSGLSLVALALFGAGGRILQIGDMGSMKMGQGAAWYCGQPGAGACNAPAVVPLAMVNDERLGTLLAGLGFLLVGLAWAYTLLMTARRGQWPRFTSRLIVLPLLTILALIGVMILMDAPFAPSLLLAVVALPTLIYGWVDRAPAKREQPAQLEAPETSGLAAQ